MQKEDRVILGAGITGLGASLGGGKVFEAQDRPGGLCQTVERNGYLFDYGGHWLFGDEQMKQFVAKRVQLRHYERNAGAMINHIFKAPIQSEEGVKIRPGSMQAWFHHKFGHGMCKLFFDPFNKRYTSEMYQDLIQDEVTKSPDPKARESYNSSFSYPVQGIGSFCEVMAKEVNVAYRKRAVKVDLENRVVHFADGDTVRYKRLISTIPLRELLRISGLNYTNFPFTSVGILNIGGEPGRSLPKEQWIYTPFCKSGFFRAGVYSNVEPGMAPAGKVSFYVERAVRGGMPIWDPSYPLEVIMELVEWGWLRNDEVIDRREAEYAYTWMTSETRRSEALDYLKRKGVLSIGRYGRWKFMGMLDCLLDGLSATQDGHFLVRI